jgi:AcrR family transcriptional regulator
MRRVAAEIGLTQPALYSAFPAGRQAVIDAIAIGGFRAIAEALEAVSPAPLARMRAYLDFAATHPHVYEAMFTMPSELRFGTGEGPESLRRAFSSIEVAFAGADGARAEVAWATVHGLASLQLSGRLPSERVQERLQLASEALSR